MDTFRKHSPWRWCWPLAWTLSLSVSLTAHAAMAGGGGGGGRTRLTQSPGRLVLVTYWGDDRCGLVDIDAGHEIAVIDVGNKPYDAKVDTSGRFAYVTCSGGSEISVIDLQAMLESHRIPVGASPRDIALTTDGTRAVVANAGSNTISVVDLVANHVRYSVPVGNIPYGVDLSPDNARAAVTCWGAGQFSVVDLGDSSGTVAGTIPVGALPYTVSVPPPGTFAYLTSFGANQVTPVNINTLVAGTPFTVGKSPWGLASSTNGLKAVVANFYSGDVSVLNFSAGTVTEARRIPVTGAGMPKARPKNAVLYDNGDAVVSDLGQNELIVLNSNTGAIVRRIAVGKAPYGIAIVPLP